MYYICHCVEKRTKINKKPDLDHFFKKEVRKDSFETILELTLAAVSLISRVATALAGNLVTSSVSTARVVVVARTRLV